MSKPLLLRLSRFHVSEEKCHVVTAAIAQGSTPGAGFYALIGAASLIASLGLVANSPAVIIGAMLVSPLMSPIFGISLGMIRGDGTLMASALRAEISGMILAVAFGALFGLLPFMTELTPEMLARTQPTLLDLLVAVFAGFAGTLAMVDDRISPALPGVAIATAIVPPLTTCGLCLAVGARGAASGAFLLFFANFTAILVVSALTFLAAGLAKQSPGERVFGKIMTAVLLFLLVAAYLSQTLAAVVRDHRHEEQARTVIQGFLDQSGSGSLVSLRHKDLGESVDLLAVVRAPKYLDPAQVAVLQERLIANLGKPARLAVRTLLAKDVYPIGTTALVTAAGLDDALFTDKAPPDVMRRQMAEQTLREILAALPQVLLLDVDLAHFGNEPVIMATVQSFRTLLPEEIATVEQTLRLRLNEPRLRLMARCQTPEDIGSNGRILLGQAHFGSQDAVAATVDAGIRQAISAVPDLYLSDLDVAKGKDGYLAQAEIVGPRLVRPEEIAGIESQVAAQAKVPVRLAVGSRVELMVTSVRSMPRPEYIRQGLTQASEAKDVLPQAAAAP